MNKSEFEKLRYENKKALIQLEASISQLQKDMKSVIESNNKFYDFLETDYYDLEERGTRLERLAKP